MQTTNRAELRKEHARQRHVGTTPVSARPYRRRLKTTYWQVFRRIPTKHNVFCTRHKPWRACVFFFGGGGGSVARRFSLGDELLFANEMDTVAAIILTSRNPESGFVFVFPFSPRRQEPRLLGSPFPSFRLRRLSSR